MSDTPLRIVAGKSRRVSVAGDICIDVIGVPRQRPGDKGDGVENWQLTGEIRTHYQLGGALLLAEMIKRSVGSTDLVSEPILEAPEALSCGKKNAPLDISLFPRLTRDEIIHSVITADLFKTTAKSGKDDKTLRVSQVHGFSGPTQGIPSLTTKPPAAENGTLLVLDDTGNRYRKDGTQWRNLLAATPDLIVHKLHRPLPHPENSASNPLFHELMQQHADRTVVVISADDMRIDGGVVSRQLSWERTARELLWHLCGTPQTNPLAQCRWLIVRFGLDGAVCWHNLKSREAGPRAWLIYDPTGIENQFAGSHAGQMVGYGSAFVAGLVGALASDCELPAGADELPNPLRSGIMRGLHAARLLLLHGYGKDPDQPAYQVDQLFTEPGKAEKAFCNVSVPVPEQKSLADPAGDWTILRQLLPGGNKLYDAAAGLAMEKGAPKALDGVPLGSFGVISTYDRDEIEGYRAISNLMREYLAMRSPKRPLCFAVFGPPGSGKSFGVKQVAASAAGETVKLEEIVFNLSQFRGPDELAPALHLVRDAVLKGRVPLVFFDEFDASVGSTRLFWLKYLLAPMQDGEFLDQGVAHPIGRAIFVFAGGTSSSYAEFTHPPRKETSKDAKASPAEPEDYFRTAKGKDFVSRLRGFLDIRGADYGEVYRGPSLLRRANVLRFQLKEKAPHLFDAGGTLHIDPGVLRAFLEVGSYEHGIRSLEALLDMSMLSNRDTFDPGCLPSPAQLSLHVTPKQASDQPGMGFLDLVHAESPWPDRETRAKIAERIHEAYLRDRKLPGGGYDPKKASHQLWEQLSEFYRDSNRAQADDIPRKLRLLGLDWRPSDQAQGLKILKQEDFEKGDAALLKLIDDAAKAEHDRWCAERRRQGWVYGAKEDLSARTHPSMQEWDELDQKTKDKDLNTIRSIPDFLGGAKLVVVKPTSSKRS